MDIEKKVQLVLKRPTEEVVTLERLRHLFETNNNPRHYIGFEISGFAHLGTGLMTALKIKDFIEAGIKPIIFLADYHSWINKKLGGNLEIIRKVAGGYFKHVFLALGLDEDKVEYVLGSTLYDNEYWAKVIKIGNATTLSRVKRAITIMGRKESESIPSSFIIYPLMQSADIFKLGVDIAHAGTDQRKVHMLALDIADKIGEKKFVAVHTHLIPSLQGGNRMNPEESKMSKSKPKSAIFVHDSIDEIKKKISTAYCPPKETEGNPVFEIAKYIIIRDDEKEVVVERPQRFGGDITLTMPELEAMYREGKLHPADLKSFVAKQLITMLEPVRDYFKKNKELLEEMNAATITR